MAGSSAIEGQTRGAAPLTSAEAADIFRPLVDVDALVLAVSGGPDSVALMHFAASCAEAARGRGMPFPRLAVATVDHGLRPGSRREAELVVAEAARLGLDALVLTWQGEKPMSRLQERARHTVMPCWSMALVVSVPPIWQPRIRSTIKPKPCCSAWRGVPARPGWRA